SKYSPATTHQKHCASPPPVLPTTSGSNDALDCCLRTSHVPIPRKIVLDYVVQRIPDGCPIHAVVFITVRGKQLCAPPHAHWVRRLTERLDTKGESRSSVASEQSTGKAAGSPPAGSVQCPGILKLGVGTPQVVTRSLYGGSRAVNRYPKPHFASSSYNGVNI
uniref:C-C motif chemokine n=1 Tax=Gopherus evgoodei TaxID=1825980 RepID=A0A8C4WEA4_9SAUR